MLSHISWHQYLISCGILLTAYYLLVLIVFYNKELTAFFRGKGAVLTNAPSSFSTTSKLMGAIRDNETGMPAEKPDETETLPTESPAFSDNDSSYGEYEDEAAAAEIYDALEQLSAQLRRVIENCGKKGDRVELTEKLRREITSFPERRKIENFKEAINQFIKEQSLVICQIRIEPADIKAIWSP